MMSTGFVGEHALELPRRRRLTIFVVAFLLSPGLPGTLHQVS